MLTKEDIDTIRSEKLASMGYAGTPLVPQTNTWTGGIKHDQEKPPINLIDPDYLDGLANVLGFGAKKYAAHNWRAGIQYSRLIAAAYRHLGAINRGENLDPESGMPHVYHLACCNMFLASMMQTRPDLDDRYVATAPVKA